MATPHKEDQEMEETKRIMERLVKTPHKPHKEPTPPKKATKPKPKKAKK